MSPQADALSTAYVATQTKNAAKAAVLVKALWDRQIDPGNIAESANKWLALAVPIILRYREQSVRTAGGYYGALRALELPGATPIRMVTPDLVPEDVIRSSLWVQGPGALLRKRDEILERVEKEIQSGGTSFASPGLEAELRNAARQQSDMVANSALRHTMNGGRNAVDQTRLQDKLAVGYYRETDGDPCYFCAMLASRGIVFKEDSFDQSDPRFEGPGDCKVHDSCACHNRPAFTRADPFPGNTKMFAEMWKDLPTTYNGRPTGGANAIRAFRHLYDSSRKES